MAAPYCINAHICLCTTQLANIHVNSITSHGLIRDWIVFKLKNLAYTVHAYVIFVYPAGTCLMDVPRVVPKKEDQEK